MLDLELFALLECTADATYTVSADGEICSWNAAAARLFGYSAEEAIGRNIDDVARFSQTLADEVGDRRVVFDHEHSHDIASVTSLVSGLWSPVVSGSM